MKRPCKYCGKIRKGSKVSEVCENCGMLKVLYPADFLRAIVEGGPEAVKKLLAFHKAKKWRQHGKNEND